MDLLLIQAITPFGCESQSHKVDVPINCTMQERERDLKRPVLTYNPHYRGKQLSLPRFDCLLGSESLSISENLLDFLFGNTFNQTSFVT